MELITRNQAARQGLSRFFTGRPCAKDHTAQRYTSSGNCVECARKAGSAYSQQLKAAKGAPATDGTVEYVRRVPATLVGTLDAVITAADIAPLKGL